MGVCAAAASRLAADKARCTDGAARSAVLVIKRGVGFATVGLEVVVAIPVVANAAQELAAAGLAPNVGMRQAARVTTAPTVASVGGQIGLATVGRIQIAAIPGAFTAPQNAGAANAE